MSPEMQRREFFSLVVGRLAIPSLPEVPVEFHYSELDRIPYSWRDKDSSHAGVMLKVGDELMRVDRIHGVRCFDVTRGQRS